MKNTKIWRLNNSHLFIDCTIGLDEYEKECEHDSDSELVKLKFWNWNPYRRLSRYEDVEIGKTLGTGCDLIFPTNYQSVDYVKKMFKATILDEFYIKDNESDHVYRPRNNDPVDDDGPEEDDTVAVAICYIATV